MEIVATCARHQERAEAAAALWGAAAAFDRVVAMLSAVELDGVIVSVPLSAYAEIVRSCVKLSVPVFCEKPDASSAAEAMELADLAVQTQTPVVVGYMKRFAPASRRARDLITATEFGPPSLGAFTFAMGTWPEGGLRDYLIDNPVHHLDLARYLLGELGSVEVRVVSTDSGFALAVIASAASGAVCTLNFCTTASWVQRNEYVEIYGAGHAVWVENVDTCVDRPPDQPAQIWPPNHTVPSRDNSSAVTMGFVLVLSHFREVVEGRVDNQSDLRSAAATLALAERLCSLVGV